MELGSGAVVIAHILFILGVYVFSWGMMKLVKGSANAKAVLKSPVFWGLLMILAGFCAIAFK